MTVVFRVDASSEIGTGHVRRCLALADALRAQGAMLAFVTRDLGLDVTAMIREAGFDQIVPLPEPDEGLAPNDPEIPHAAWGRVPHSQDAAETVEAARAWSPDWVVIDSYAFDARWHAQVARALGCQIAVIDDLADRALDCSLVIDHNHAPDHRAKYERVLERKTRILGGPRFALLGPAYAVAPRYEPSDTVRSIGVFMGGVDAGNHSQTVLEALDRAGYEGPVEVVSTSANPNLSALTAACQARASTTLSLDLPDLASFFARHDLQVGAGGGASWERCCIGVPTLLVVTASNQNAVAPLLADAGVVAFAQQPSCEEITRELDQLIKDGERRYALAAKSRELVDGRGAQRAALAMGADRLAVRQATRHDAQLMFEWRNHPSTRAVSGTSDPLDWEAHCEWLDGVFADDSRQLFIGEIGARPVGVIRFDFASEGRAEVSLFCDPALHGLGLGPRLLLAGEAAADPVGIDATVLEDNRASQVIFARCGYQQTGPTAWVKDRLQAGSCTATGANSDEPTSRSGLPRDAAPS